jgi:hypothetical protein
MKILTATLITDGTSDRTLLPIVQFLLDEWSPRPHRIFFAEGLHHGPLEVRLPRAMDLYPSDLLFVHRDAETATSEIRQQEIESAIRQLAKPPPHICLIPVRMTESWLLLDHEAIRAAAGNPQGTTALQLPIAKLVEKTPDPKSKLFEALVTASERTGRRKRQFKPEAARHRVAELMNFSKLRQIASFAHAEAQVKAFFKIQE